MAVFEHLFECSGGHTLVRVSERAAVIESVDDYYRAGSGGRGGQEQGPQERNGAAGAPQGAAAVGRAEADRIVVQGAREHNLKDVGLELPRNAFIVFTGLSGSGKSSLAFDTIFAEGQRRYVESLSAYARQFLGQMDKPDVDFIEGLSPAVAIDQKSTSRNPRSTVGTITEIYEALGGGSTVQTNQ